MEIFDTFISYPDSDSERSTRQADVDVSFTDRNSPNVSRVVPLSDLHSESIESDNDVSGAISNAGPSHQPIGNNGYDRGTFSKSDLDYIVKMSSWTPVVDYHPFHVPDKAGTGCQIDIADATKHDVTTRDIRLHKNHGKLSDGQYGGSAGYTSSSIVHPLIS